MRARIIQQFLFGSRYRLLRNDLPFAFPSAYTDREIRRADAGILRCPETLLHDPVLQRMKSYDGDASAGGERIDHLGKGVL